MRGSRERTRHGTVQESRGVREGDLRLEEQESQPSHLARADISNYICRAGVGTIRVSGHTLRWRSGVVAGDIDLCNAGVEMAGRLEIRVVKVDGTASPLDRARRRGVEAARPDRELDARRRRRVLIPNASANYGGGRFECGLP